MSRAFVHYLLFALAVALAGIWVLAALDRDAGVLFGVTACQYCLRLERAKVRR